MPIHTSFFLAQYIDCLESGYATFGSKKKDQHYDDWKSFSRKIVIHKLVSFSEYVIVFDNNRKTPESMALFEAKFSRGGAGELSVE